MSKQHVPIKNVTNIVSKEFSTIKCKRNTHKDLDNIVQRVVQKMDKKDKCNVIKTKAKDFIKNEKPERKKPTKVATNLKEKRSEQLFKEAGLTRRQMLSQKLKIS